MKKEKVELFNKIVEIVGDLPILLYGKSLLFMFLNKEPSTIELFIKSKQVSEEILFKIKSLNDKINIKFGKELIFENEIFTVECISCDLKEVLGKTGNVEGKHLSLTDLKKRNLRFIDKENSSKNPKHILEAILFSNEIEFNLEIDSMRQIIINKNVVKNLVKREIFHFLKSVYFRSSKPRKTISLLNTLGISKELFDKDLLESSVLNNLGKKDINEFFALVFNNIEEDQLETFLVEKVGFHLRDVEKVVLITKILNDIPNQEVTPLSARKLLRKHGKDQALPLYRLFKAIGQIELSHLIKSQKKFPISYNDLCIDEEFIIRVFNVDSSYAKKLLDLALDLVIINPELNDRNVLLSTLNKQKSNIH